MVQSNFLKTSIMLSVSPPDMHSVMEGHIRLPKTKTELAHGRVRSCPQRSTFFQNNGKGNCQSPNSSKVFEQRSGVESSLPKIELSAFGTVVSVVEEMSAEKKRWHPPLCELSALL